VCAHVPHVYRPFAFCVKKVFYYFIIERVCQYIAIARANKTREKWSITASTTVPRISDRPVAKYRMKLIHSVARFTVRAAELRN